MEFSLRQKCLSIIDIMSETIDLLLERNAKVNTVNDYLSSPYGMEKLDANCMRLQTIGENLKQFDAISEHKILPLFKGVCWSQIMWMRDYISHHYDGVDPDIVFDIIKRDLPALHSELKAVREYVDNIELDFDEENYQETMMPDC